MQRASVVVVGGGVIGTSIAFHLAEAGVDVLLLERAELGSGATGKGAGGLRAMFSDELNVQIGVRSLEAWAAFGERPGWEIDLRQVNPELHDRGSSGRAGARLRRPRAA